MRTKKWTHGSLDYANKGVLIWSPIMDFAMEVDYDDVDHPKVRKRIKWVVEVLNAAEDAARAALASAAPPEKDNG
jgi:hypothetical protein